MTKSIAGCEEAMRRIERHAQELRYGGIEKVTAGALCINASLVKVPERGSRLTQEEKSNLSEQVAGALRSTERA